MRLGGLAAPLLAAGLALALVPLSFADDEAALLSPADGWFAAHPEPALVRTLVDLRAGELDSALGRVAGLVRQRPDFQLAQLVYGDLMAVQAGRVGELAMLDGDESVAGLRQEAQARLQRYLAAPPNGSWPRALLKLPPDVETALLVDLERYRLYVYESRGGGSPRLAGDFYVSIGKGGGDKQREGDEKTPVGVYRVASFLPGETLPDMYGVGAFPIDYPNLWDRKLGRTGSGIWIHGTESDRYSRAPLSSLGCVTLSNGDFDWLRQRVRVGRTPVVVSDRIEWSDPEAVAAQRGALESAVDQWRRDWESRDSDRYLSHYSNGFTTTGMDYETFAQYKRRVNASKSFIRVEVEELAIYSYPGEQSLVMVEFQQRYQSDTYRASKRKQQYWRWEGGAWKIVYEVGL